MVPAHQAWRGALAGERENVARGLIPFGSVRSEICVSFSAGDMRLSVHFRRDN